MRSPCSARLRSQTLSVVRGSALGLMIAACLSLPTMADESVPLDAFDGQWQRISDESEDAARLSSIASAIEDLSWMVRKMASGVLSKSVTPAGEIAFVWDGEALHQRVQGPHGQIIRPVRFEDGPLQQQDGLGEDTTVEWRRTSEGLEVHWTQSRAFGHNVYRLDSDDQILHVEHRLQVTAIDGVDEIVHVARFERESLPAVSSARGHVAESAIARPIGDAKR